MPNKPPTTAVVPSNPAPPPAPKVVQTQFINILKTDHNYDIVAEIIKHMAEIKRAKKIKPLEKHRLLKDYHITLLSYCLPRIKIQETIGDDTGKVIFNINIGGDDNTGGTLKKAGGKGKRKKNTGANITVNTTKGKDGTFTVTDPTD
jgi:hypothetical protein